MTAVTDRDLAERARVLRAGQKLIGQDASHRTTIEDVLREARVNRRIFYRHFASKDEMVLEMVREAGHRVQTSLEATAAAQPTAADAIAACVVELLAIGWDELRSREGRAFTSFEITQTRGVPAALEAAYQGQCLLFEQILSRGISDGSLPQAVPQRDAFAIHGVVIRYLEVKVRGCTDLDLDGVRDQVLGLFLPAMGARM